MLQVDVANCGSRDGHFVGVNEIAALKHPLDFLTRRDRLFVRTAFHPVHALIVGVGLGDAGADRDHHDRAIPGGDIFRIRVDRRAHVLGSDIGHQIVEPPNVFVGQSNDAAQVVDPNQDSTALAVGECGHFTCQRSRVRDILGPFELRVTIFTASNQFDKFDCFHSSNPTLGTRTRQASPSTAGAGKTPYSFGASIGRIIDSMKAMSALVRLYFV